MWSQALLTSSLSSNAKVVAWRLTEHLNLTTGRCDPSIPTLAAGCGISKPHVDRGLKELRDDGWIRRKGARSFELLMDNVYDRIAGDAVQSLRTNGGTRANRIIEDAVREGDDDAIADANRIIGDTRTASPAMRKQSKEQGQRLKALPNTELDNDTQRDRALHAPAADGRREAWEDQPPPYGPPPSDERMEREMCDAIDAYEHPEFD